MWQRCPSHLGGAHLLMSFARLLLCARTYELANPSAYRLTMCVEGARCGSGACLAGRSLHRFRQPIVSWGEYAFVCLFLCFDIRLLGELLPVCILTGLYLFCLSQRHSLFL